MKRISRLLVFSLLVVSVLPCNAQQEWNAAGVWTGSLFNDTTKKFIPFEIAISYGDKKYSGYTYTVFVIDSVENIGVKSVSVREKNGLLVIRDKKLIDDNYRSEPDKGVYTTLELTHSENDSIEILSGHWFTNRTKEFYPVGGAVRVTKRKNIFATRIIPKLRSLGLLDQLSFYDYQRISPDQVTAAKSPSMENDTGEDTMMTIVEQPVVITFPKKKTPEIDLPDPGKMNRLLDSLQKKDSQAIALNNPVEPKNKIASPSAGQPDEKKPEPFISMDNKRAEKNSPATKVQVAAASGQVTINKNTREEKMTTIPSGAEVQKPTARSVQSVDDYEIKPSSQKKADSLKEEINSAENAVKRSEVPDPVAEKKIPVLPKIDFSDRKIETIRTVQVSGDSLVLSLFDNGTVDGDTVSVILNGEVILSKIGLLASAYNKTIHLVPEMGDSVKIILYAENLGSIPPNTGLLVVRNNGQNYEIRFSGDLQRNSAIILLRKKEEE